MSSKVQLLRFFSLICFVCLLRAKKLCDVRVWYLNLINDDVFDVDLTDDQLKLKITIETLVMKASESRDTRMLECSTLYLYNDMLKDLFNYMPSGSGMALKEVEGEDLLQTTESVTTGNTFNPPEHNGVPNKQTIEKSEESLKKENVDDTEEELENGTINIQTDKIESSIDINNSEVEALPREPGTDESASSVGTDSTDYFRVDDTDHLSIEEDQLDETEYLDDTDLDLSASDDVVEADENYHQALQTDKECDSDVHKNQANTLETKKIPLGVCYSFGCLAYDVFDVYSSRGSDTVLNYVKPNTKAVPVLLKRKLKLKCPLKKFCTLPCYYKFLLSKSFCMVGFMNNTFISSENNVRKKDGNKDKRQNEEETVEDLSENVSMETLNSKILIPTSMETSKRNTDIQEDRNMNLDEESSSAKTNVKDKLSLTEFESIVEEKTRKYYTKIQNLEVMIMKLENQLLMAALNKQNHSSTITKLENQILKFENELLRMNKNYQNLRSEAENTNKWQHKYLELAYKQLKKDYPKLPDKSSQKYELITQHQTKINELGELLRNQSSIIMQLQKKQNHLEEQNKMLHEMVMNQTIFMNSIVTTVQDLSEQNIKNQKEISALRLKVKQNSVASVVNEKNVKVQSNGDQDVIDELDTLVFNNLLEKSSSVNTDGVDSKSKITEETIDRLKLERFDDKRQEKSMVANWCPRYIKTCPSCQYSPYVNTNCLPYRNVVWSELKKTISEEQSVEDSDYPTVPDVIDAIKRPDLNNAQKEDSIVLNDVSVVKNEDNKEERPGDDGEEVKVSFDKDKITNANNDKDLNRYTLVGYDRDGKPVLKIREDLEGFKARSGSLMDDTKVQTEPKIINTQNNEEFALNKHDMEKEQMTNTLTDHKTDGSQTMQVTSKTLDMHKSVSKEFEGIKNQEVKDIVKDVQNEQDKFISNDEDTKKASNTADSDKENNVDKVDTIKRDSIVSNQDQYNESRNKISVDNENEQNNGNKSQIDQVNDKPALKNNEDSDKENLKKNKEQQSIKDSKSVKTKAKEGDRKKMQQSESKPRERKIPIYIDKTKQSDPKDCYDIYLRGEKRDGLYKVTTLGSNKQIQVFCDMRRGGWTVIQRRQDGSTNFFQEWNEYRKGFGGLYGEHWLGNDNIHYLTNQDYYNLRVDLMDWEKTKKFADFEYFLVDSEEESYKLHIDGYTGDAGDGLTKHDGSKFSTKDVDNDRVVKEFGGSCAKRFHGAGWYYKCYASNLNGKFYKGGKIPEKRFDGITWKPWTGPNYSLKKVEMKIRPASAKN